MSISIKTEKQIEIMREAGKKLAHVMRELENNVKIGISTYELDQLAEKIVRELGGKPAFKGYGSGKDKFPSTICSSLNDEVVHGIPCASCIIKDGDVLKIDIGMKYKGFYVDMARTFLIGNVSNVARELKAVAEQCFWEGIKNLKPGDFISDYSKAVEGYIGETNFSIVKNLVGHGIGKQLHEEPQIANFYDKNMPDYELKVGMTLALEPMINEGSFETEIGEDGWVFKTEDGKLSAHYENTVLVTEDGVEVLTISNQ